MSSIFEKASRQKIRFQTAKGLLTTEQLWDLPLTEGEVSLLNLSKELIEEVDSTPSKKLSFFKESNSKNEIAELKFELVKHIVTVRVSEAEHKEQELVRKSQIDEIDKLIAAKENEARASLSIDELKALKAKIK